VTPSQLERQLRRLTFELASALNAYAWSRTDLERDTCATEVRAARERLFDAWSERNTLQLADFYGHRPAGLLDRHVGR
jgi:hypothetical protein